MCAEIRFPAPPTFPSDNFVTQYVAVTYKMIAQKSLPDDKMSYTTNNSWLPAGSVYNDIQHMNLFCHTAEILAPTISIPDDTQWHNREKLLSKYEPPLLSASFESCSNADSCDQRCTNIVKIASTLRPPAVAYAVIRTRGTLRICVGLYYIFKRWPPKSD